MPTKTAPDRSITTVRVPEKQDPRLRRGQVETLRRAFYDFLLATAGRREARDFRDRFDRVIATGDYAECRRHIEWEMNHFLEATRDQLSKIIQLNER